MDISAGVVLKGSNGVGIVNDYRKRYCRDCKRLILRGEKMKRAYHQNNREFSRTTFICRDCYVDAKGDRIL
ncbi:MAG TPA: hypothetical protein VF910_07200 [Candidatus Bathyarchaeia archaeon]